MKLRTDLPLGWRVRSGIATLIIPVLLLGVPLDRLTAWLGRSPGHPAAIPPDRRIAAWIDSLLHRLPWPWRHTCLRRSAVLLYLLRRGGRPVEMMIGVRRDETGALAAHAWLILDGQPYLEPPSGESSAMTPIARFPEHRVAGR